MKTKITLLLLLLSITAMQAQKRHRGSRNNGPEFKNAIRINTLPAMVGQYQLTYERALNDRFSIGLSPGYISRDGSISVNDVQITKSMTTGFIVIPEGKFYFKETFDDGFYAGAFIRYKNLNTNYTDLDGGTYDWSYKLNRSVIGGGVCLGYHYTISDRISMDYFIGPHYKSVSTKTTFNNPGITENDLPEFDGSFFDKTFAEKTGVGVRMGFNIGFLF